MTSLTAVTRQSGSGLLPTRRRSLELDGSAGFVTVPDDASLRVETNNAFSASFWLYLDSYNNNVLPRIWEKRSQYMALMGDATNGKYRKLAIEVAASADNGNGNGGVSEYWGSTSLSLSTWYHVVGTFDGATDDLVFPGKIYLNGVLESMDEIFDWNNDDVLQSTSGVDLYVGRRRSDLARNLDGRVDDFRLWNRRLSDVEALAVYEGRIPREGLVLELGFDESAGSTVYDTSGDGNDGTLSATGASRAAAAAAPATPSLTAT